MERPRPHSSLRILLALTLPLIVAGTLSGNPLQSQPYERKEPSVARTSQLFTRLGPEATRIEYSHRILGWHPEKRLFASSFACGSTAVGDLDLDGLPDLFFSGGPGSNKVYLQAEKLVYVDVTNGLQISDSELWASGAAMVDIDNDFDLDIFVCYYDSPNKLYVNQFKESGRLWFEERSKDYGLDLQDASLVPAFADYDSDGDLDLYLLTHRLYRKGGRPASAIKAESIGRGQGLRVAGDDARYYRLENQGAEDGKWSYTEKGRPDYLLRNDDGVFVDVSKAAGISRNDTMGNSAIWWDYNQDGKPDLFVGNDGIDPDALYRNNGNGTFTNVAASTLPYTSWHSAGATLLDANNDGQIDLLTTDRAPTTHFKRFAAATVLPPSSTRGSDSPGKRLQNALYLHSGVDRFYEASRLAGIHEMDWTWTVKSGDFDHDGREDLFFCNGAARNFSMRDLPQLRHEDLVETTRWSHYETKVPEKPERNLVFQNREELDFREVGAEWGLAHQGMSYTSSVGDLDNDGDLDLILCSLNEPVVIYRNEGGPGNSVRIRLRGTRSNSWGIGARVTVSTPSGVQVRELRTSGGFLDADEASLHFGLGQYTNVQRLEVKWPSGIVQTFERLRANQIYTITEQGTPRPTLLRKPETWFRSVDALSGFSVQEADASPRQPLLPFQLSRFGPSQAWGDVDGNQVLDLYLGGPSGSSGRLIYNKTPQNGALTFNDWLQKSFRNDQAREDAAAVFLDVDSDGDMDLYVGSGGVESEPGDEQLRDRILVNYYKGNLG